ncbi:MAG: hypothetical protein KDK24_09975 [Pseudooceanicola sp.]|nr:hypothetical protein [Pseudooceanicola sp.]
MKAFLSALILAAAPAAAQNSDCGPHESVVATLAAKYGETIKAMGLEQRGAMLEVFASDETGSWTIVVTAPGGLTCLIASGQGFDAVGEILGPTNEKT